MPWIVDDVFVCWECNTRVERTRPCLYEWKARAADNHDWSHTLVLAPSQGVPLDPAADITVEQRLARLEAMLGTLKTKATAERDRVEVRLDEITSGMHRMETLLGQLV